MASKPDRTGFYSRINAEFGDIKAALIQYDNCWEIELDGDGNGTDSGFTLWCSPQDAAQQLRRLADWLEERDVKP